MTDNDANTTTPLNLVRTRAGRLREALFRASLFAAHGLDDHPVLCAVRFEVTTSSVRLIATDRYKLSVEKMPHRQDGDVMVAPFDSVVALADVEYLRNRLSWKHEDDMVDVSPRGSGRIVIDGHECGMQTDQFPLVHKTIEKCVDEMASAETAGHVDLNPVHVAPLLQLDLPDLRMRLSSASDKPVFAWTDGFIALIMPLRPDPAFTLQAFIRDICGIPRGE